MLGELDKKQIEDFLKIEMIGRIGCYSDGRVYVVPVTYAYENGYIYGHTKDGLKIRMMRDNPNVCFEIDLINDIKNWKSVIIYGIFEELKGYDAEKGLEILLKTIRSILNKKDTFSKNYTHDNTDIENFAFDQSFLSPFVHSNYNIENFDTLVYRIKVNECTGRFEKE